MPGLYVQFGLVWSGIACFALVGLIVALVRGGEWRKDRAYRAAHAAWKAKKPDIGDAGDEYDLEHSDPRRELVRSWRYTEPRQPNRGYNDNEGWAILGVLLGAIGIILVIVSFIVPVTRNYDERQCGRKANFLDRETKFVIYGGGWSWDCLVRSRDGKFIPVDSLTEIRGDIVTHEGTPDDQ